MNYTVRRGTMVALAIVILHLILHTVGVCR
jgi:hypothetical protein